MPTDGFGGAFLAVFLRLRNSFEYPYQRFQAENKDFKQFAKIFKKLRKFDEIYLTERLFCANILNVTQVGLESTIIII